MNKKNKQDLSKDDITKLRQKWRDIYYDQLKKKNKKLCIKVNNQMTKLCEKLELQYKFIVHGNMSTKKLKILLFDNILKTLEQI
jgi:hypothetical protein